jgi:hypothetical protein
LELKALKIPYLNNIQQEKQELTVHTYTKKDLVELCMHNSTKYIGLVNEEEKTKLVHHTNINSNPTMFFVQVVVFSLSILTKFDSFSPTFLTAVVVIL